MAVSGWSVDAIVPVAGCVCAPESAEVNGCNEDATAPVGCMAPASAAVNGRSVLATAPL